MRTTEILAADTPPTLAIAVSAAVARLRAGEVVALPSETVYGLAADALQPAAAARIFEAKERPFFDPLICHLPDLSWLERLADIPLANRAVVQSLAEKFWPGPLTLVLPRQTLVPDLVTSGLPTVAVRMTSHPVFSAVLRAFGGPLAAPSANRFGRLSPTRATHVLTELGGRIPLILDGGPSQHGLESTIVAVESGGLRILRPGPITSEQLSAFGQIVSAPATAALSPEAPGQLASHYAPAARMILVEPGAAFPPLPPGETVGLLAWRHSRPIGGALQAVEVLSPAGDLREAAATLFAKLRRLDNQELSLLVCETVPLPGLGLAIMDRLRKGAAARPSHPSSAP